MAKDRRAPAEIIGKSGPKIQPEGGSNPKNTYRKLKVELQAPDGGPIKVHDQKGKEVKYIVYAREGYTAKHTVE